MKLSKKQYTVSKELLERILEILHDNWFSSDESGDSYNNDDCIELTEDLEKMLEEQER